MHSLVYFSTCSVTGTRPDKIWGPEIQSRSYRGVAGMHLLVSSIHIHRKLESGADSGHSARYPAMEGGEWPLGNCARNNKQKTFKLYEN